LWLLRWGVGVLVFPFAVLATLGGATDFLGKLGPRLAPHLAEVSEGKLDLTNLGLAGVVLLVMLAGACVNFAIDHGSRTGQPAMTVAVPDAALAAQLVQLRHERDELDEIYEGAIGQFSEVVGLLRQSGIISERYRFESVCLDHVIGPDGDTRVTRRIRFRTERKPGIMLQLDEDGDEEAEAIETVDELRIQAVQDSGGPVRVVPLSTDYRKRKFALFFGHPLPKGASKEITFSFLWKGYFRKALLLGRTEYTLRYEAANRLADASFECLFRLQKDAPALKFRTNGGGLGHIEPQIPSDDANGETVWTFRLANFDPTRQISFVVERK
jgi:hypothetical protein